MKSTKEKTIDAIEELPDEATYDDIILKIATLMREVHPMSIEELRRRIDQSEEDIRNGNVIEAEKLLEEVKTWT